MGYREQDIINKIKDALKKIEYGSILITIHDGKVTQIDQTEKWRFTNETKKNNSKIIHDLRSGKDEKIS